MTKPPPDTSKLSHDLLRTALSKLAVNPRLKAAARGIGVDPTTLFRWLRMSREGDPEMKLEWLGAEAPFHTHVEAARKLSIVAMDASARDQAINGWEEPKFDLRGNPVWKVDPVLAAEAQDPVMWAVLYDKRPITDVYVRDENKGLVQESVFHPPNAQLLVKMLSSLAPDIYADRSEVSVTHAGHVWIGGEATKQIASTGESMNATMGLIEDQRNKERPLNTLAVPRACVDAAEFDEKFCKKLLPEIVIFRDDVGKVEPPLNDDVIVEGSRQHKLFVEAGYAVEAVPAEKLVAEGYQNAFLFEIIGRAASSAAAEKTATVAEVPPVLDQAREAAQ